METKVTTHIVKGVILGAVYILLSTIIYAFNLYSIKWLTLLIYLFIFAGIIISNIVYANQNNNNESFGNIFADGFKTTSLFIIISIGITKLFFLKFFLKLYISKLLSFDKKSLIFLKRLFLIVLFFIL